VSQIQHRNLHDINYRTNVIVVQVPKNNNEILSKYDGSFKEVLGVTFDKS